MKSQTNLKASHVHWMGQIPSHWDVKRLKFVAQLISEKTNKAPDTERYVGLEHIEGKTGKFLVDTDGMQSSAESTVNRFKSGDVLFGKLRPYLAKAVVADTDGNCTSELLVYRPKKILPSYLKHAMLLEGFIQEVNSSTYGSKMPRADSAFIGRMEIPVPPIEEQLSIGDYIEFETKRIDELIDEKCKLLGTLAELKKSAICEFIQADGEVWKVVHAFRLGSGTTPPSNEEHWYSGSVPWVQTSELREREITRTEKSVSELALSNFSALKIYPAGTLMVAMYGATIGRLGILGISAACNQACCALVARGPVLPEFLFWWLYVNKNELLLRASGGTQPNISSGVIANLRFNAPDISEQRRRVALIKQEVTRLEATVAHVENEIELLRELRLAAITDAVLGRVDISHQQKYKFKER